MEHEKQHIVPYKTFLLVLAALLVLTGTSVAVTHIYLGPLTVTIALLIAVIKSSLVLSIFMHLKFDRKIFAALTIGVILLVGIVIFITLLDYLYR